MEKYVTSGSKAQRRQKQIKFIFVKKNQSHPHTKEGMYQNHRYNTPSFSLLAISLLIL